MAYFDSLKNQAKWNAELAVLRREKEMRRKQGFVKEDLSAAEPERTRSVHRRPITLDELIAIEQKVKEAKRQHSVSRMREKRLETGAERAKEPELGR